MWQLLKKGHSKPVARSCAQGASLGAKGLGAVGAGLEHLPELDNVTPTVLGSGDIGADCQSQKILVKVNK